LYGRSYTYSLIYLKDVVLSCFIDFVVDNVMSFWGCGKVNFHGLIGCDDVIASFAINYTEFSFPGIPMCERPFMKAICLMIVDNSPYNKYYYRCVIQVYWKLVYNRFKGVG